MSISIYLFSRIIQTTTVSILHGVFFLSSLPLLLSPSSPPCFFSSFSLSSLQFLSFAVRLHFAFPLPFPPSSAPFLFFPPLPPVTPFSPFGSFTALRLLPTSPFSLLLLPFSVAVSRLSHPVFRFLFSFLCLPSLSFSFSSSLLARAGFANAKASGQSKCERLLLEISEYQLYCNQSFE